MSAHNIVWLTDASYWPTTCGGKKMKWPFIFKITHQHTNNWEADNLFTQCTIVPPIDVSSLGYGQIYNILSNDQRHEMTIGNFLRCLCVYFVRMLVGFLGAHGCICIVNMCITSCKQSCFVGSQKSSFITTHGVGMKLNVC
jgi:hypothetical protein